ncbi:MAG: type II toxin-antitoxin system YoeB family toxin [Colwellia sp.]|nr:type II toxin-antitoxin system YoeB family toxin [Colwellia sp.]
MLSRRINKEHRIIYTIADNAVIIACFGFLGNRSYLRF